MLTKDDCEKAQLRIGAKVIADSISPQGRRLTTMQITAHRFILAEINTHRVFSRNYRSSRAVPVKKLLEEVRTNPAMPIYWGANRPGMQACEELPSKFIEHARETWLGQARSAADAAECLMKIGLHKQIANRILEPFLYVHGVITATEWDNFWGLRCHKDAQPEMRVLAAHMHLAYTSSTPELLQPRQWHLPFIERDEWGYTLGELIRISVARCARVTHLSFETGNRSIVNEDLDLYEKLVGAQPMHASPAEHQATPDEWLDGQDEGNWKCPEQHGNFVGWRQYRKTLPGEAVAPLQ